MAFEGPDKRKKLISSMGILAAIVIVAGFATMAVTGYFRSKDPLYQCIDNPTAQPFQLSIPISVTENGAPAIVPKGVGISEKCIHPIHTLEENMIHVAYSKQYNFTLGHFLYYWIGNKLHNYDVRAYIDDVPYTEGKLLDVPLKQGEYIRLDFRTKS